MKTFLFGAAHQLAGMLTMALFVMIKLGKLGDWCLLLLITGHCVASYLIKDLTLGEGHL